MVLTVPQLAPTHGASARASYLAHGRRARRRRRRPLSLARVAEAINGVAEAALLRFADRYYPEVDEPPSSWIATRVTCTDCGHSTWVDMPFVQYKALGPGRIEAPHHCTPLQEETS